MSSIDWSAPRAKSLCPNDCPEPPILQLSLAQLTQNFGPILTVYALPFALSIAVSAGLMTWILTGLVPAGSGFAFVAILPSTYLSWIMSWAVQGLLGCWAAVGFQRRVLLGEAASFWPHLRATLTYALGWMAVFFITAALLGPPIIFAQSSLPPSGLALDPTEPNQRGLGLALFSSSRGAC